MSQLIQSGGVQVVTQLNQIVYLDFDGEYTSYNGEILNVDGVVVEDSKLSGERIAEIVAALNEKYAPAGVNFVTERPIDGEYSTVYVGKTDDFDQYGNFAGLAETVDKGNANKSDKAFVILDSTASNAQIVDTISHETDHLLGTLDHGGEGVEKYAVTYSISSGVTSAGINISGEVMHISDGGVAIKTNILMYGRIYVSSGGIADSTTITLGSMFVLDKGIANATTVYNTQQLHVSSGGIANGTVLDYNGYIRISAGGTANGTIISKGQMYVLNSGVANDTTFIDGTLSIASGGLISTVTVNSGYVNVSSGGFASDATLSGGYMCVSSGGSASDTTLNGGDMYISSGGFADNVTLKSSGYLYIASGGTANNITWTPCEGKIIVQKGAFVTYNTNLHSGVYFGSAEQLLSHGINMSDKVVSGEGSFTGSMYVFTSGIADNILVSKNGYMFISEGGTANSTTVNDGGSMSISSGGVANSTTVNSYGRMDISSGGVANNTTVNSGGSMSISSGGVANMIKENGGYVAVADGANVTFVSNTISGLNLSWGMTVHSNTVANNTTVNSNGRMYISSGGTANSTTVNSNGYLYISSGGIANNARVSSYGNIEVSSEGIANGTVVDCDGLITITGGIVNNTALIYYGSMIISSGGTANSTTVNAESLMIISSGGTANNTSVNSNGRISISSGGTANNTTVKLDGNMHISNGGIANRTTVNSRGSMSISSGGTANNTTVNSRGSMIIYSKGYTSNPIVNSGGYMHISSGGSGNMIFENGGYVDVADGANVTFASHTISGMNLISGSMTIHSNTIATNTEITDGNMHICGGIANKTAVNSISWIHISSGGTANDTTVNSGGYIHISSGGTANDTIVKSGGTVRIYNDGTANDTIVSFGGKVDVSAGGTANCATISNGVMAISNNGVANSTNISDGSMGIYFGGVANSTLVNGRTGGVVYVYSGGTASNTRLWYYNFLVINAGGVVYDTVCNGGITVSSGGSANQTTVHLNGNMNILSGGTANDTTITSGGRLKISSGGTHNGKLQIFSGAMVSAYGTIDFTVENMNPEDEYLINDLSKISGSPTYTITVSDTQETGKYRLAQNAGNFNSSITIGDESEEYGSLTVNGEILNYDHMDYYLTCDNGDLVLTVSKQDIVPPNKPTAKANITTVTNQNVTVTAEFASDSVKNEYRLNGGEWTVYQDGIVFQQNGYVEFRSTDKAKNISDITVYRVSNIDKVAPNKPTAKANVSAATNQDVTVTAEFASDSVKEEYRLNGGEWTVYQDGIVFQQNGYVEFRSTDEAGNISDITTYRVSNIDKVVPNKPTAKANIITVTNQDVTVTAEFASDSVKNEYRLNSGEWTVYQDGIVFQQNGYVEFRNTDKAGNISDITTYQVSNIDKVAPTMSQSGNPSVWTNKNAVISAVGKDTDSGVAKVEYSFDKKNWTTGTTATATENGTVYWRVTDKAGNIYETSSWITKIDKTAPGIEVSADRTSWTNKAVTLTAAAKDNASGIAKVEYSLDGNTWISGSTVSLTSNGTVDWRVTDLAGNVTSSSSTVKCINKSAPVFDSIKLSSDDWTFDPVTVTPSVSDDLKVTLTYHVGDGAEQTYSGETIVVNTPSYIYFTAVDEAGNSSTQSVYVKAGYVPVSSGGVSSGLQVSRGKLDVYQGGTAANITVLSGGSLQNSGNVSGIHVSSGAIVAGGGRFYLTSNTEIASGMMGQTQDQNLIGVSTFSKFAAADNWHVDQKLLMKEGSVASGGSLTLYRGASATILNNYGYTEIQSKANARTITVYSNAMLHVNGGIAAAAVISRGGSAIITNGGSGLRTSVYGSLSVLSNGIANSTTVFQNGALSIGNNGLTKSGFVSSGGTQRIFGGSSYRDNILPGGSQVIASGGTATETNVSAGLQYVLNAGVAENAIIIRGSQYISGGGVAENTVISGVMSTYKETLTSSYEYTGDRIYWTSSGGETGVLSSSWNAMETSSIDVYYYDYTGSQFVSSGGSAVNTLLTSGAIQTVFDGGSAIDTTVEANAFQYVLKNGSAFDTDVASGGIYAIEYDGYGENVTVANGGAFALHGTVRNLTLAKDAAYYFDLGTAVFQGNLDCYLDPSELETLNEILMFSELDSLTLRIEASQFGQDEYKAFSTENNEDIDYRFVLVLENGKTVTLREDSHYWYNGECYSLSYDAYDYQYSLNKFTQEKTHTLVTGSSNIDILESQSRQVYWSSNAYQTFGEVVAVQETGIGRTVYLNTGITVNGMLQEIKGVEFVSEGTLQFGTNTITIDLFAGNDSESIVYGVYNAASINRRLASLPSVPSGVVMNISASAEYGSAHAAAFMNKSSGMLFSGGVAGNMNVKASGYTADARGIYGAGTNRVTEPITGSASITASASGGRAFALGAGILLADDLDMSWNISAASIDSDAEAVGIAASSLGQWTSDSLLQVSASAGKNAKAFGFAVSDHQGLAIDELSVSEIFAGTLSVSASGSVANAVGIESNMNLSCDMASKITVSATGVKYAEAIGALDVGNSNITGSVTVSAIASGKNAKAIGFLGDANILSSDLTVTAQGGNSVEAFAFASNFESSESGSVNTISSSSVVNVVAKSSNSYTQAMSPVYAIGGKVNKSIAGTICVTAVTNHEEQETFANAAFGQSLTISGKVGASASTQAVAVVAESENTNLSLTVSGILFAGDVTLNNSDCGLVSILASPATNLSTLTAAKDRLSNDSYSVYAYDGNDTITLQTGSYVIGDMELAGGSNTLTISNGAYFYGDINAENGSLKVNIILDSAAGELAVMNGKIAEGTEYSIDVSKANSRSIYILASDDEMNWNGKSFTIIRNGYNVGSLQVGKATVINSVTYTLEQRDEDLYLYISSDTQEPVKIYSGNFLQKQANILTGETISDDKLMVISSGGTANQTIVSSGGVMNVAGKANYTSAFNGGTVTVSNGGSMFGVNLYSGADLNISSGGNVNTLFYNGPATATIHSGGQLTSTTVNSSGTLNVYDGAKVTSATLKNGGTMNYYGGTAYNVELLYGGVMNIQSGAVRKGQIADKGQMFVSNGGTASGTIIKNGGIQHVLSGGSADDTQIWLNGVVHVSSGAIVTDMLTKHGAKVHVFGGTISNTTMERGITSVYQGGKAVETEVGYGAYLMLGFTSDGCSGVASSYDTTVLSGGGLTVMSGAVAEDTVNYGTLTCNNGGTLLGDTVIHGRANLAGNAIVTSNTAITFDVSSRAASAMQESYREAMLNSYYVAREADMTISVSADQAEGSYILANWALEAKKGTFTLEVDGTEVGTFSTTKSLTYNGKTYSLYCFDDSTNSKALTLKVCDATSTDAWTDLGSGDFDGDGIEESLVSDGTNLYAASENLWLGNLSGTEEIASIVDYNNDGTDDLLIHNTATDQMTAWLVKDGTTYSTLAIA